MSEIIKNNEDSDDKNILIVKESRNSVRLKMSTKGVVSFDVKVYDEDVEDASSSAEKVFDELKRKYQNDEDKE